MYNVINAMSMDSYPYDFEMAWNLWRGPLQSLALSIEFVPMPRPLISAATFAHPCPTHTNVVPTNAKPVPIL